MPRTRIKYLWYFIKKPSKLAWWQFVNCHRFGFTELTYRGIPIILRDDVPEDEMLLRQKDGIWKHFNIKTRRVGTLKEV